MNKIISYPRERETRLIPADLFRMYRQRSELNYSELSRLLGFKSDRMVQIWEGGYGLPTASRLQKLIEIYLDQAVFAPEQARQEVRQLWDSVRQATESFGKTTRPYPEFDNSWFEKLLAGQTQPEPASLHSTRPFLIPPPEAAASSPPDNLPAPLSSFIGREREIATGCALLHRRGVRLLTLIGPAGTGKTRLALRMAANLLDEGEGRDGLYFVALATATDADQVLAAIAQALDVKETAGQPLLQSLKRHLHDKQTLLVLDNFEQVVSAGPLIAELLVAAPRLKALATSRQVLQLYGEQQFEVPPLRLPSDDLEGKLLAITKGAVRPDPAVITATLLQQSEAVQLFVERAKLVKPDFVLTPDNAAAVTQLCRRLDGLPLALELAAAQVKLFSPAALVVQLGMVAGFQPYLRWSPHTSGDRPERQQTLERALDWSYRLLSVEEQQFFRGLGVFVNGWTAPAAKSVVGLSGEGLTALVDKSLVKHKTGRDGQPRFELLETLREYTLLRLRENRAESGKQELDDLHYHHALYYLELVEEAGPQLTGPEQTLWYARLEDEHDNLRAALGWLLEQGWRASNLELAARLAAGLRMFWWVRGYLSEGRRWLETTLAQVRASKGGATVAAAVLGKLVNAAGTLAFSQNDYGRAHALYLEALRLHCELQDKTGQALNLNNLGSAVLNQGDFAGARKYYQESLKLRYELGDTYMTAVALGNLGTLDRLEGDYVQAEVRCEQCLTLTREVGNQQGIARALNYLGAIAFDREQYERSAQLPKESLTLRQQIGDRGGIAECLERLAGLSGVQRDPGRAARLFGAAERLRETIGAPLPPYLQPDYDRDLALARKDYPPSDFATAWAEGRALPLDHIIVYGLERS